MTLIIACACKDGIVIGADSQMTMGSSAGPIRKITLDKIIPVTNGILIAGAGDVSIIQKIKKKIDTIPKELKDGEKIEQIKELLCNSIVHSLRSEMLNKFRDLYGSNDAEEKTPSATLILAGYQNNRPIIYEISPDGIDVEIEDYCAIGIGVPFSQVILKDFNVCSLSIEEGKLLVYKVISDAIETGAYGMGFPIKIWTITNKGHLNSDQIEEKELKAIEDTVKAIRELTKETFLKRNNNSAQ